jgi:hypothetical protein
VTVSQIAELKAGSPMLVRAVCYLLVRWWLTGLAWFAGITIVGSC